MGDDRISFAIIFGFIAVYEAWQSITAIRIKRARKISFRKAYVALSEDPQDYWFATVYHGAAAIFAVGIVATIFVWS